MKTWILRTQSGLVKIKADYCEVRALSSVVAFLNLNPDPKSEDFLVTSFSEGQWIYVMDEEHPFETIS